MNLFKRAIEKTFDFFGFGRKHQEASGDPQNDPLARKIKRAGFSYDSDRADEFINPSFDLNEVNNAYNTDSNVRQALDKYIELMFKANWNITYKSDKVKDYMKKRLVMLSDAMGKPIDQFWRQMSEDLVKFSNVFIVKARKDSSELPSFSGVNIQGVGDRKPVAGYFRLPPETMSIMVDQSGTVKKYKQEIAGEEKEFNREDIIHITYKKPAGRLFGVPFSLPVLEDVKLLREIEDNIARLIYRHLYPLFIYQIGLAEAGYEASNGEIEEMQQKIQDMQTEGGLVVPERHDVDIISSDEALDAHPYLKYFERRVFTGLGTSETVMGRGDTANRSTAESQATEMRDKVRAFQTVMQDQVNYHIIRELLLEGGFSPVENPDHKAEFKFNEIDIDLKIKQENHAIYKYEHNAKTHEEMREDLGLEPVKDESRLYGNMFDGEENIADTNNRTNPQNQHSQDKFINDKLNASALDSMLLSEYLDFKIEVIDSYESYCLDIVDKDRLDNKIDEIFEAKVTGFKTYAVSYMRSAFESGMEFGAEKLDIEPFARYQLTEYYSALEAKLDSYLSEFSEYLKSKLDDLLEQDLSHKELCAQSTAVFESLEYKLSWLATNFLMLAYNYGFASIGQEAEIDKLYCFEGDQTKVILLNEDYLDKLPLKQPVNEYYLTYEQKGGK